MKNRSYGVVRNATQIGWLHLSIALTLISFCSCAQETSLAEIERLLTSRSTTVSDILTSTQYLALHGNKDFRNLIREHAPRGNISVAGKNEPGTRIQLKGRFVGKDQKPRPNVLFYFYHTMHNGLYAEGGNGQQDVARLFGYMRTDKNGNFEINTIKPAGYPGERFPSHVHVEIYDGTGKIILGTEFQFEDDPRLDKESRENSVRHGNLVAANSGSRDKPVYFYSVTLP